MIISIVTTINVLVYLGERIDTYYRFNKYVDVMGVDRNKFESIEYRTSPPWSMGLQTSEVIIRYNDEPEYIYHYEYFMVPRGIFESNFYPNLAVVKNGSYIEEEDYEQLKNCIYSYDDYILDQK